MRASTQSRDMVWGKSIPCCAGGFFASAFLLFVLAVPTQVLAQDRLDCENALARAEDSYNNGRFDDALGVLRSCLRQGAFPEDEQQKDVYLLIGRANYAKDLVAEAKDALRQLLSIVPNYQPDTGTLPPSFVQLLEEVRTEMEERAPPVVERPRKKGGMTKWLLIGGGAVATGVLVAVLAGGGGNGNGNGNGPPLPDPPPLPTKR